MAFTPPPPQVALVTGASSGMGKETAKRLLQASFTLVLDLFAEARGAAYLKALAGIAA